MFGIDWEIKAAAILLALAGIVTAALVFVHQQRAIGAAQVVAKNTADSLVQSQKDRATEQARTLKIQEAQDAETKRRVVAEVARKRSDAAASSLRDELAATREHIATLDSSTAAGCKAAVATTNLLTELLGQCSQERRAIASFAEDAAGAGQLCVGSYDALK